MTRFLSAATIALLVFCAAPAEDAKKPAEKDELKLSKEEQAVIDLTNAERKKAELPLLKVNPKLMAAARSHAENMAKQEKLEHELDCKTPADRVKAAGYKFSNVAENIEWNASTPAEAVKDWMESPPHKENMLGKEYVEIGVAVAKSKKGEPYWVQVFGKQLGK